MRISDWSSDVCSSDLFAAFEKIEHPAGRGDQDVDAAVQLTDLVVEALAADQEGVVQLLVFTVELEILSDLRRQLAGGLQDQSSEERRVGKECVRTFRSTWSAYDSKKKNKKKNK